MKAIKTIPLSLIVGCFLLTGIQLFAHDAHEHGHDRQLRSWHVNGSEVVKGDFLMYKDGEVYLQGEGQDVTRLPLSALDRSDRQFVLQQYQHITRINEHKGRSTAARLPGKNELSVAVMISAVLLFLAFVVLMAFSSYAKRWRNASLYLLAMVPVYLGFRNSSQLNSFSVTDPLWVDSAFTPFKPNVVTSWDSTYFYIESLGIPTTHLMMTGITKWQQQVPIPQCYILPNAWKVPLNPVVSATPIPVDSIHFTRGAIAIAVNGVPIFNYHTNTGVDAFLDGQLDQWGGHSGRADDYHYHIAPMHLYGYTSNDMPIAYALDGFAIYGNYEPDGSAMAALDGNNGHYGSNGVYHYHGVAAAPYMIGNMVGVVTEDSTHQIIPQPRAYSVRPSLTPLNGAVITGFHPNGNNGYTLIYTLAGAVDSVVYSWTGAGVYTYNFYTPAGVTTSNYNGFVPCSLSTPTGITSLEHPMIRLFPNPSSGRFSMILPAGLRPDEVRNVMITDARGSTVFFSTRFEQDYSLDNLPAGIYHAVLRTDNDLISQKLIIR